MPIPSEMAHDEPTRCAPGAWGGTPSFITQASPVSVRRNALLTLHESICMRAAGIMEAKNHDYSGDNGDPFANFRGSTALGVHPTVGVLLRMQDEIMRVATFANKGQLKVAGEGVQDALLDIVNYAVIIAGMIEEETSDVS